MEHKGFDQYTADLLTLGRYIADAANIKSCTNDDYTELAQKFFLYHLNSSNAGNLFQDILNDDTFHKHLHQITKQLLVGSLRYIQLILIQFLLSDNFTTGFASKTIDLRTEDACCSVALYNIIDDFHLDNVPFYVYDFTEYCKKFVAIKKIESAAKGAAAKLLNELTGTMNVPIILEAGYLHYGDYEVFSNNLDAHDIVPDIVKYYESLGFKNVSNHIGHYEESVVMLYDKTNLFSEEPKNIFI